MTSASGFASVAVVATDAAERYAKQLLAHLGHKVTVEALPQAGAGRLLFSAGIGYVLPQADALVMRAVASDPESLLRVQDVLTRHLEKFGARRSLSVVWEPIGGAEDDLAGSGPPSVDPAAR